MKVVEKGGDESASQQNKVMIFMYLPRDNRRGTVFQFTKLFAIVVCMLEKDVQCSVLSKK